MKSFSLKTFLMIVLISLTVSAAKCSSNTPPVVDQTNRIHQGNEESPKIQVAILLDASSSMDGLINQAKARLWSIVNTLSTLKYDRETPTIEIALYIYGNDGIPAGEGHIRQLLPFTKDLDLVSEKLFSITTYGGSEYCGMVIEQSLKNLQWDKSAKSMKLIYIAGNEPFTQGRVEYKAAVGLALENSVFVNTIHCGNYEDGVTGKWKDGADRGKGKYFNINSNQQIRYIVTPYDEMISQYNTRLNGTYIYYGSQGYTYSTNQTTQDVNATSISKENQVERTVSKSKAVYDNTSWDMVDKVKQDKDFVKNVDKKTLPKEYQNFTTEELQKEIDKKTLEREQIQKEIQELAKKRQAYIDEKMKEETTQDDFGLAITTSIKEFAKIKGYQME